MNIRNAPPFRADHVGSFLRPSYLLEARAKKAAGKITSEELREVEDRAIEDVVRLQAEVGLSSITDGEFRRTYFHIDFLDQLSGVKSDIPVAIRKPDGTEELAPPAIRVVDKVRHIKDIQRPDFLYLKSKVQALGKPALTPKVTIPSPTMLHFRGGRAGISKVAYPPMELNCNLSPTLAAIMCRWMTQILRTCATNECAKVLDSAVMIPMNFPTAMRNLLIRLSPENRKV
jgi:5-methyltetrahydropteroyltriglutamate--homocysteine methyltransferase